LSSVSVCVDGVPVAVVPLWMIKHAVEDAIAHYPDVKIIVEVN
jgi:hypothetical protein